RPGHDLGLVPQLARGRPDVRPDLVAGRRIETVALAEAIVVLVDDLDVLGGNAELLGHDPGELRLGALGGLAEAQDHLAGRVHAEECCAVYGVVSHRSTPSGRPAGRAWRRCREKRGPRPAS